MRAPQRCAEQHLDLLRAAEASAARFLAYMALFLKPRQSAAVSLGFIKFLNKMEYGRIFFLFR